MFYLIQIMGESHFSQEVIEQILQYADGETLLTCKEVSPIFAEAVKYLSKSKNIWEKCFFQEIEKYPYDVISKIYPHKEGFNHAKTWELIYEMSLCQTVKVSEEPFISEMQVGKDRSDIHDIQTHGELILVLVKYNKNFSRFYRILTINLDNEMVGKSCRFNADMVYVTPMESESLGRRDVVRLNCSHCNLVAVPVDADVNIKGYPKFKKKVNFLTVEHSNGDYLWLNNFQALLTKGSCFHVGRDCKLDELKIKDSKSISVFQRFTSLFVSCGETHKEFNTFKKLRANVTASMSYSNLMILGTDTGNLYVYHLGSESDLKLLDLDYYIWHFNMCSASILMINVMELKSEFVIVCSSVKSLYQVRIRRNLRASTDDG